MKNLRRLLVSVIALALLVQPALATWSIVIVNVKTGEVAVSSATCLGNTNLIPDLPLVLPGFGAAAVQSSRDRNGARKIVIRDGFLAGLTPQEILDQVALISGHKQRQYGIVDMGTGPVTFTGAVVGQGKHGVVGVVGDLRYAIQGNVLVGPEPVDAAEAALLATPGDVGQKLIAAMEAAAAMGGDGRCSCDPTAPTSCGAPPPGTWKSAHTGFLIVARTGDPAGMCTSGAGCANGKYYLKRNAVGAPTSPDPILTLRNKYTAWRAALSGRPDHIHSSVSAGAEALVADGLSQTTVVVQLVDVDGVPLTSGGAALSFTNLSGATAVSFPGGVLDHGDGSYEFTLTAGLVAGDDLWEIKVDDGVSDVRLFPRLALRVDPLAALHSGFSTLSAAQGGFVPLTVNYTPAEAGLPYIVLATSNGTLPGTHFGSGFLLPLNRSRLLLLSRAGSNLAFQNTQGLLDANGRAQAGFLVAPGLLTPYIGQRIDWSAVVKGPTATFVATPAGFDVLP